MESSGDVSPARLSAQTHLRFGVPERIPRTLGTTRQSRLPVADLLSVSSKSEIGNGVTRGVLITPAHVTQIYI